jgi:hypothetical protein
MTVSRRSRSNSGTVIGISPASRSEPAFCCCWPSSSCCSQMGGCRRAGDARALGASRCHAGWVAGQFQVGTTVTGGISDALSAAGITCSYHGVFPH